MKRILLTLALLLAPVAASAQCNGVFANNTICGNNSGASAPPKQVPLSALSGVAGGSPNQIQYNNAGAFGGFTMSGDGSVVTSTGVFSLTPLGVTNPKLALMTQNTIKGAATSTTPTDLAVPSCSSAANALQWLSNTGPQCLTLGTGTPIAGDLTTFSTAAITPVVSAGYNAKQVPGMIPTTSVVTISNGSPAVVTWAAHGLSLGDTIFFCNSGGAINTGLTACVPVGASVIAFSANTYKSNPTLYYVVPINANTFNLASSLSNARAGTPLVNTTSAGSGTQTAFANAMACTGCVGEMLWDTRELATGSALPAIDSSAGQTVLSFSVPSGLWKIWGSAGIIKINASTAIATHLHSSIVYGFTTIATAPYGGTTAAHVTANDPNGWLSTLAPQGIFLTAATTINLVATSNISPIALNVLGLYGTLRAERYK